MYKFVYADIVLEDNIIVRAEPLKKDFFNS